MTVRFAVIDPATNKVANVTIADAEFDLPGFILVQSETAGPGDHYDPVSGEFTRPEPAPPTKQDLAEYAAHQRWQKEIGGMIWNGWPVHTDRESQSKIIAERLAIEAGERADPDGWKFADGSFRLVSNEEFISLSNAIRQHVRDCFAMEALVLAQIEAGAITTTAQIDAAFA